ncbi:unnamed protein product, partial [Didymodactylos carnosus]
MVVNRPPLRFSTRMCMALLVLMAFLVLHLQRINLPISITCMINKTVSYEANPKQITLLLKRKQYHWSESNQQLLLGAYWAGYIFTQIPGGWLASKYGCKIVYFMSLFTSSIITLISCGMYFMADTEVILIVIFRFFIGITHAVIYPVTMTLWSQWAVPEERGTLISIGYCGTHLGTAITMFIGGILCRFITSGWLYLFLSSSLFGFLWCLLWYWKAADSPLEHKTISDKEKQYISAGAGIMNRRKTNQNIPWKKMLASKPLIALISTDVLNLFGFFFFTSNLGKIMVEVHQIPVIYTGIIAAAGFLCTWFTALFS